MSSCAVSSKIDDIRSVPVHVSSKMFESSEQSKRPVFSAQHFTFHLMQHLKHTSMCYETVQYDMYVLICIWKLTRRQLSIYIPQNVKVNGYKVMNYQKNEWLSILPMHLIGNSCLMKNALIGLACCQSLLCEKRTRLIVS